MKIYEKMYLIFNRVFCINTKTIKPSSVKDPS